MNMINYLKRYAHAVVITSIMLCLMFLLKTFNLDRVLILLFVLLMIYLFTFYGSSFDLSFIEMLREDVEKDVEKPFRILVGVDGSEHSKKAVKYAASLAAQSNGEVILLHVVNVEPSGQPVIWLTPEVEARDRKYLEELKSEGEMLLKEEESWIRDMGIEVSTHIEFGDPAEKIVEVAEKKKVDIIALGVRGMSKWKKLLVGSVSERVIEMSKIPVLVIR